MKLNPAFVQATKRRNHLIQVEDVGQEHAAEKPRSPDNSNLIRIWESACPTMHRLLAEAGILEEYANVLNETALQQSKAMPGDIRENEARVRAEMIPCYEEQEAEWLRTNLDEEDVRKLGLMPYEDEYGRLVTPQKVAETTG